ncbi:MAG: Uncharacterised protein [Porticoccaceae bacterium UBA1117]|nr:MAG: Uncharacterised protein [Porticoccaceae bacterium UBA1117]
MVRCTLHCFSTATSSKAHCTAMGSVPACRTSFGVSPASAWAAASTNAFLASIGCAATSCSQRKPSRTVPPTVLPPCEPVASRWARSSSPRTMSATSAAQAGRPPAIRPRAFAVSRSRRHARSALRALSPFGPALPRSSATASSRRRAGSGTWVAACFPSTASAADGGSSLSSVATAHMAVAARASWCESKSLALRTPGNFARAAGALHFTLAGLSLIFTAASRGTVRWLAPRSWYVPMRLTARWATGARVVPGRRCPPQPVGRGTEGVGAGGAIPCDARAPAGAVAARDWVCAPALRLNLRSTKAGRARESGAAATIRNRAGFAIVGTGLAGAGLILGRPSVVRTRVERKSGDPSGDHRTTGIGLAGTSRLSLPLFISSQSQKKKNGTDARCARPHGSDQQRLAEPRGCVERERERETPGGRKW